MLFGLFFKILGKVLVFFKLFRIFVPEKLIMK